MRFVVLESNSVRNLNVFILSQKWRKSIEMKCTHITRFVAMKNKSEPTTIIYW